ncbi:MAG: efflux RND transporter periplasmic adaptor subunit [Candidatus Latescibacterota bacterium]|nr:MAG: efflux RND transporter periplasmic adaptor subunit [Candidatus Latescibacterota bacterium]
MSFRLKTFAAALALLAFGAALLMTGCGERESKGLYHCPMHPTVISDKPGECPICFMNLVPIPSEGEADDGSAAAPSGAPAHGAPAGASGKYICPMCPGVVSDDPNDRCPTCGMKLEPAPAAVPAGAGSRTAERALGLAPVTVSSAARERIGLTLGTVERRPMAREVRTVARIATDEKRLHRVTLKFDGWVERLFVAVTGQEVARGEPLLTIYSPELLSAELEYLAARRAAEKMRVSDDPSLEATGGDLLASARKRLELWDIGDGEIDRLEKTGEAEKYVTIYAPASGVVLERNVLPGERVAPGAVLMTVADLGAVWADASIYESDLRFVRVGMPFELTLPYWPGKSFTGEVIFVSPTVDPATRTLIARLAVPNRDLLLKPGMFGDARLFYELGERLTVPETAVMFSGTRAYAFRDEEGGRLAPVEIEVGTRADGRYEVVTGLFEGDRVVTSANFLIDSESSLAYALQALTGGGSAGAPIADPAAAAGGSAAHGH